MRRGWRGVLLSLLREPRLKPPQGPARCVVQIFKRGDRASQGEASASCQKLTGTRRSQRAPPCCKRPGAGDGAPAKERSWRKGKQGRRAHQRATPLRSLAELSLTRQCLASSALDLGVSELPRSRGQGSSERRGCPGQGSERNRPTGTLSSKGWAQLPTRKRNQPRWGPQPAPFSGPCAVQPLPEIPVSTSRVTSPDSE